MEQSHALPIPGETLVARSLDLIASVWQTEASSVQWTQSGFDWCPGSHRVRVRGYADPHRDHQAARCRITVATDVLKSVPIGSTAFSHMLDAMAPFETSTYSLVYPPLEIWKNHFEERSPSLSFCSSGYVSADTLSWLPKFLAQAAILQPIKAETASAHFPKILGAEPEFGSSGKRQVCHDILRLAHEAIITKGSVPSPWCDTEEFIACAEQYGRSDFCLGTGDGAGLSLETPFGSKSALIRLRVGEDHPQLGTGLLVTVQLPFASPSEGIIEEAANLNFAESAMWTDFPQFGCWHSQDRGDGNIGLTHSCFIPTAFYKQGLATNLALWSVARVRWVRELRFPDLRDKSMPEILRERFGR